MLNVCEVLVRDIIVCHHKFNIYICHDDTPYVHVHVVQRRRNTAYLSITTKR